MRRFVIVAVSIGLLAGVDGAWGGSKKSQAQKDRESAWKRRMAARKLKTGEALHSTSFLGLQMGCTRAQADRVVAGGPREGVCAPA